MRSPARRCRRPRRGTADPDRSVWPCCNSAKHEWGRPSRDSTGCAARQCAPLAANCDRYIVAQRGLLRYNRRMREIFVAREHEISDGERKIIIDDKVEIGVFRI